MPLPKITKKVGLAVGVAVAAAITIGVATYPSAESIKSIVLHVSTPDAASPRDAEYDMSPIYAPDARRPKKVRPPKTSDFDKDGVRDTEDDCPWNKGPRNRAGCP